MNDVGGKTGDTLGGKMNEDLQNTPELDVGNGSPRVSSSRGSAALTLDQQHSSESGDFDPTTGNPLRSKPSDTGNDQESAKSVTDENRDIAETCVANGEVGKGDSESGVDALFVSDELQQSLEVAAWIRERLTLPGFSGEKHWQEEHDQVRG